jgi:hypothetical protein
LSGGAYVTGSDLVLTRRVREIDAGVKRWRSGTMVLRWTAAGVLEAECGFCKFAVCSAMQRPSRGASRSQ